MIDPPIVVQKYGGSSVADIPRLRRVAEHVASTTRRGIRVVVVVSAMGKTTDELVSMAKSMTPSPSRRELDMLLSTGERISMSLLAMALAEHGIEAISFTGSQSGILTNDRHSGARIIEVRPVRIEDELARGKVVIVAGFQGMSYKREITTLGRGGSDTTAVALAAALSASACEIYSDVDGVYTADPRVVSEASHIPYIGYEEMQELSDHGAKVLNAQAVEWAKRAGIVIHARKTGYQLGDRETLIVPRESVPSLERGRALAVTGCQHEVRLFSAKNGVALLGSLAQHGVPLRQTVLSATDEGYSLSVCFVRDDLPDFSAMTNTLMSEWPELKMDDSAGSVTAVGAGLGSQSRCVMDVVSALKAQGIAFQSITTSPFRISAWISPKDVSAATNILHRLLIS